MAGFVRAEIKGHAEMLRKLSGDPIHAKAWKRLLRQTLYWGRTLILSRAPTGETGRLKARTRYRVPNVPMPLWGVITNSAVRKKFRYGFALDYGQAKRKSGRVYQFHRRGGGGSTKGWFTGAKAAIEGRLKAGMATMEREVEQEWRQ